MDTYSQSQQQNHMQSKPWEISSPEKAADQMHYLLLMIGKLIGNYILEFFESSFYDLIIWA